MRKEKSIKEKYELLLKFLEFFGGSLDNRRYWEGYKSGLEFCLFSDKEIGLT